MHADDEKLSFLDGVYPQQDVPLAGFLYDPSPPAAMQAPGAMGVRDAVSTVYDDAGVAIPVAAQNALETLNIIDRQILDTDASRDAFRQTYAEAKGTIGAVLDETGERIQQATNPEKLKEWKNNLSDVSGFTRAQYGALIGAGTVGLKRTLEGKSLGEVAKGMLTGAVVGGAGAYFLPKVLDAALAAQGVKTASRRYFPQANGQQQFTDAGAQNEITEEALQQLPGLQRVGGRNQVQPNQQPNFANVPASALEPFNFTNVSPDLATHAEYTHFYNPDAYERAYTQYQQRRSSYPAYFEAMRNQGAAGQAAQPNALSGILGYLAPYLPYIMNLLPGLFGSNSNSPASAQGQQKEASYDAAFQWEVKEAGHPLAWLVALGLPLVAGYFMGSSGSDSSDSSGNANQVAELERRIAELEAQKKNSVTFGPVLGTTTGVAADVLSSLPFAAAGAAAGGLYGLYNYNKRKKKEREGGPPVPESSLKDISYGAAGGALALGGIALAYNSLKSLLSGASEYTFD